MKKPVSVEFYLEELYYSFSIGLKHYGINDIDSFLNEYTQMAYFHPLFYFRKNGKDIKFVLHQTFENNVVLNSIYGKLDYPTPKLASRYKHELYVIKKLFPHIIFKQNGIGSFNTDWFDTSYLIENFPTRTNIINSILNDIEND